MKGLFGLFAILPLVGIGIGIGIGVGIYVSYRYVQWLVESIAVIVRIMAVGTVVVAIIFFVLYKMGYRGKGGD